MELVKEMLNGYVLMCIILFINYCKYWNLMSVLVFFKSSLRFIFFKIYSIFF